MHNDSAVILKMKQAVKKTLQLAPRYAARFRLEVEDQPEDLLIHVKDIAHGSSEVETDALKAGVTTLTYPTGVTPVSLALTMYDTEDERVSGFFKKLKKLVVNNDGTVNLPYGQNGYVKKVKKYSLLSNGTEKLSEEWEMFVTQCGESSQSNEDGGHFEFTVTFIQFRSL